MRTLKNESTRLSSRCGYALVSASIVTLLLMVFSGGVLSMSQANLFHGVIFERRQILEQATLSLAHGLADEIAANADSWWPAHSSQGSSQEGKGAFHVDSSVIQGAPQMRFHYTITPRGVGSYVLLVRGEYLTATAPGTEVEVAAWDVSMDISTPAKKTGGDRHVRL
ncbi:MAG: hypothetical protein LBQ42_06030 [Synergistaceae bacterium]|jgi:hypothetical protein|nr:hypothetical protein [Synergistaceae bacterium]